MTTAALTASADIPVRPRRTIANKRDLTLAALGILMSGITIYAVTRGMTGIADFPFWRLPPAILFHVFTILPAIPLGAYVFGARKGTRAHRLAGRVWCLLMFISATSTFFIRTSSDGTMSFIHIFTVMTMISVPLGIWAAMTRRYKLHERTFLQLYVGGLIVAGGFTFLPGRTMFQLAFG